MTEIDDVKRLVEAERQKIVDWHNKKRKMSPEEFNEIAGKIQHYLGIRAYLEGRPLE